MATTSTSTAVAAVEPVFTEPERLALAGFLAGYTGMTREAYPLDLRQRDRGSLRAHEEPEDRCRQRAHPRFPDAAVAERPHAPRGPEIGHVDGGAEQGQRSDPGPGWRWPAQSRPGRRCRA